MLDAKHWNDESTTRRWHWEPRSPAQTIEDIGENPECSDTDFTDSTNSTDSEWMSDGERPSPQPHFAEQAYLLERLLDRDRSWSGLGSGGDESRYDVNFHGLSPRRQQALHVERHTSNAQVALRRIPMARRTILNSARNSQSLVQREIAAGKELYGVQHIIKLVGTYSTCVDEPGQHLLTFPVGLCNLDQFLDDCETMHDRAAHPEVPIPLPKANPPSGGPHTSGYGYYDNYSLLYSEDEPSERLANLGLAGENSTIDQTVESIKWRLKEIMGCLTQAITWMHARNVEHCDLKPSNILLRTGQLYITDFGLSRTSPQELSWLSYNTRDRSLYTEPQRPQSSSPTPRVPFASDIYSLGCIFLHILTVAAARPDTCSRSMCSTALSKPAYKLEINTRDFIKSALKLPEEREINKRCTYVGKKGHHPFTVQMLAPMLSLEPRNRPEARRVNERLWTCGGLKRLWHGPCCRGVVKVQSRLDGECWI